MAVDWRSRAATFFFMVILFGMPIFSVPCFKGRCSCPVELVADYLYANKLASDDMIRLLLYPKAVFAKAEVYMVEKNQPIVLPGWSSLLEDLGFSKKVNHDSSSVSGLVISCALCLLGALLSAAGISFVSSIGMILLFWFVYSATSADPSSHFLPSFILPMFCSVAAFKFEDLFGKPAQVEDNKKKDD